MKSEDDKLLNEVIETSRKSGYIQAQCECIRAILHGGMESAELWAEHGKDWREHLNES